MRRPFTFHLVPYVSPPLSTLPLNSHFSPRVLHFATSSTQQTARSDSRACVRLRGPAQPSSLLSSLSTPHPLLPSDLALHLLSRSHTNAHLHVHANSHEWLHQRQHEKKPSRVCAVRAHTPPPNPFVIEFALALCVLFVCLCFSSLPALLSGFCPRARFLENRCRHTDTHPHPRRRSADSLPLVSCLASRACWRRRRRCLCLALLATHRPRSPHLFLLVPSSIHSPPPPQYLLLHSQRRSLWR